MSIFEKNKIKICSDNTVFGTEISKEGIEKGYLDYKTLSHGVGATILNNEIIGYEVDYWNIENGSDVKYYNTESEEYVEYEDIEDWNDIEEQYEEVYQYYIITQYGAELLQDLTDEIVYYNEKLDMWLWGITHWGTSWDYVLTDVKIVGEW